MDHLQAWEKFGGIDFEDLPADVVQVARQCIMDWYGCAVAGATEPLAQILKDQFGHRAGRSTVIGSDLKLDASTAALLNGASGHALDYDDTGSRTNCHSTAPVIPAVMAVAQELGVTSEALLTAFVVGVEIEGRIAHAMGSDHYERGWHTTATYGTFGATAAVAHMMGLDVETYGVAMGLAASHAGGVKANFGTMTKPYHPGHSAENGINCARLAAAGFTANPDAVLGNQGFIRAASTADDATARLAAIADEWMILGTLFKHHAACHLTHASIESILHLRESLNTSELSSLTITVNPSLLDVCGISEPRTGLEGKFSLRGTAALALNGIDTASPASFVDEVIQRDEVQQHLDKVVVETEATMHMFEARVVWVDSNQIAHEAHQDLSQPERDYDERGKKLERKFVSLCQFAGADSAAQRHKLAEYIGA